MHIAMMILLGTMVFSGSLFTAANNCILDNFDGQLSIKAFQRLRWLALFGAGAFIGSFVILVALVFGNLLF